ncbi:Rgp1-domain-containing protein [Mycena maculata]|uniref:Rgp1-domain-containing protein n=1 Tax=Mycena maculata TaxID=230809 RepID=A0AAD7MSF8_9AGAR|nr:Rgp1-domain-containing protein [Mycena maculata]
MADLDPAVRIVVTPAQSSYFAGEPFAVTITFTNTRSKSPEAAPSRPHSTQGHKRNAHSISSAPIARPPTSPGTPRTPRTAMPPIPREDKDRPGRKGLIGRTSNTGSPIVPPQSPQTGSLPALVELRRKRMLAKSLSVSIAPPDFSLANGRGGTPRSATFSPECAFPFPPTSAPPALPASVSRRSDTLPLAASHPHARKHSVLDGQQIQLQHVVAASPVSPGGTQTPSASSSTFSLALDPIAESAVSASSSFPYPPTPSPDSPTLGPGYDPQPQSPALGPGSAQPRAYPPRRATAHAELGRGPPPLPMPPPLRSAARTAPLSVPPHTELLLYAYASLSGRTVLAPLAGAGTPALASLKAALRRPPRGGGSLSLQAASGAGTSNLGLGMAGSGVVGRHRRASSFSAGLRALGLWGRGASGVEVGMGIGADGDGEEDAEAPLPTLDVPPEMLAVDLRLGPGESRSYTYTLPLPPSLPPTFKGRTLRFSYELSVGVCRASPSAFPSHSNSFNSSSTAGKGGGGSVSRLMKVPIRVYNHVAVERPARAYDLRWPVLPSSAPPSASASSSAKREWGKEERPRARVEEVVAPSSSTTLVLREGKGQAGKEAEREDGVKELGRYAARLLAATSGAVGLGEGEGEEGEGRDAGKGGLSGCREAVEVLTRNLKKVSYDITKDGVTVAVLTLPKSAFRLGETVHGVVEVNWRAGRGRVVQLTALLEAHESLPPALAAQPRTPATARYLRRVHAEHHARFVLGTLRLGFALDIPSDGSPAFGVVASGTDGTEGGEVAGGLEWRVRLCLLVGVAAEGSDVGTEGVRAKGLVRDAGDGGRGAWGAAWRAPARLGVLERTPPPPPPPPQRPQTPQKEEKSGWGAWVAASFLGGREAGYHDGDEFDEFGEDVEGGVDGEGEDYGYDGVKSDGAGGVGVGVRYGGREDAWGEVKTEMVECVVPVRVWAGNTAFRAGEVVFDV